MKNRHTTFATILLALALAWVAPAARATCQEGCLSNFNTVLGEDALLNTGPVANTVVGFNAGKSLVTGGDDNTAIGQYALTSDQSGGFNTAIGVDALYSNQVADGNTAVGFAALFSNGGAENTAVGEDALYHNYLGYNNVAVGDHALLNNGGNLNTAIGSGALQSNTTASENTAVGAFALVANTTGDQNTAVGRSALQSNGIGAGNTAVGFDALLFNITGVGNTAVGDNALSYNATGRENSAYGDGALTFNPTGDNNTALGSSTIRFVTSGSNNTAIGYSALVGQFNSPGTGCGNTATGVMALANFTSGSNNTATGFSALLDNTTGNSNTAVGNNALLNNTSGASNIALGDSAGSLLTTGKNNIDIGNKGVAGEANTIRVGKSGTQMGTFIAGITGTTVAGGVGVLIGSNGQLGTINSSARYKENIQPMDNASEAILALKPVTFCYKHELDPKGIPQFGLVAEQVEKVNRNLVARDEQGKPYTVRYEAVNAMLLNEFLKEHRKVQEQKGAIAQLKEDFKATVAQLATRLDEEAAQIQKVKAYLEASKPAPPKVVNNR